MPKRLTTEEFLERLVPEVREAIEIIDFNGLSRPCTVRIRSTGELKTWAQANYLRNKKTTIFRKGEQKYKGPFAKTKEEYQKTIDIRFGEGELELLEFSGAKCPGVVKCLRCGEIRRYSQVETILYNKTICHCSDWDRIVRKEQVQNELDNVFGKGSFEVLEYTRTQQPVILKHKCGYIMRKGSLEKVRRMLGCPLCEKAKSRGERDIAKVLMDLEIPFSTEATFPGLKSDKNYALRYDFRIDFGEKTLLIEFDGEQHFDKSSAWYNENNYDERKNMYAKSHNIPLLRIPYWEAKKIKQKVLDFLKFNDYPLGEYIPSGMEKPDTLE